MMAEGTTEVEEHQHVLIVRTSQLEVIYRALLHRWLAIEDHIDVHGIENAPPHVGDYDQARALSAQYALELVDHRDCERVS